MRAAKLSLAISCSWLLAACGALAAPAVQTVLTADELDERAAAALAAANEAPSDLDAALRAARVLFQAADRRMQRAQLAWLDAHPDSEVGAVVAAAAADAVAGEAATAILSLCTEGLAAAERAAAGRPDDVDAQLHRGLHLSLVAWANGPMRSLVAGFGPRLVAAIGAAVALDPTFDNGAPLRLQGRFRGEAPWPYGDLDLARRSLEQVARDYPIVVNELFLGDVLFAAGELEAARAAWRRAVAADDDASTRWSAAALRELARRRLAAR